MKETVIVEKEKRTPVRFDCDVLVGGGGTSGVVAALAAARNGAETILIERYGFLGGTMINGATVLHSFFNLYKAFPGVEKKQLVKGISQEIVDRMIEAGGCPGHLEQLIGYNYDSFATCFDHEIFKHVIFIMLEEAGVKILLHSLIVDAIVVENKVRGVIIENKSGREAVTAKVTVDTTGDGDIAFNAGVNCKNMHPDKHGVSLTFGMANIELKKAVKFLDENNMLSQIVYGNKGSTVDNIIRVGFNLNKIESFARFMAKEGMWGPLTASLNENDLTYINCTLVGPVDALDAVEMTRAEISLRKQVTAMVEFLKKNIPGFEAGYLSWTSVQAGVRRTRVVDCEHDITLQEIENAVRFSDEIAIYGFHDCAPKYTVKNGDAFGIPYRALLPKGIENLLVAGRMITSDWAAHMSTRNTVSCMAQGQAAGTAAALSGKLGIMPRNLDTGILKEALRKDGVCFDG